MDDDTISLAADPGADVVAATGGSGREVQVLLFTPRREALLQRISMMGLPHASTWSATAVADVGRHEGYEAAAARALAALGLKAHLRFVGATFVDAPGGRRFVGVCVGAADPHAKPLPGREAVPVDRLMRAVRLEADTLDPAFAKACRLVDGE